MKLELFRSDHCPYCHMVAAKIRQMGRTDVVELDIEKDEEARNRLVKIGGKEQIPCLFIDGVPMYESADIIRWLGEHPQEA